MLNVSESAFWCVSCTSVDFMMRVKQTFVISSANMVKSRMFRWSKILFSWNILRWKMLRTPVQITTTLTPHFIRRITQTSRYSSQITSNVLMWSATTRSIKSKNTSYQWYMLLFATIHNTRINSICRAFFPGLAVSGIWRSKGISSPHNALMYSSNTKLCPKLYEQERKWNFSVKN